MSLETSERTEILERLADDSMAEDISFDGPLFARQLQQAMARRELNTSQLAVRSGVNRLTLLRYEKGAQPDGATVVRLSNALSVNADFLLGRVTTLVSMGPLVTLIQAAVETFSGLQIRALQRFLEDRFEAQITIDTLLASLDRLTADDIDEIARQCRYWIENHESDAER